MENSLWTERNVPCTIGIDNARPGKALQGKRRLRVNTYAIEREGEPVSTLCYLWNTSKQLRARQWVTVGKESRWRVCACKRVLGREQYSKHWTAYVGLKDMWKSELIELGGEMKVKRNVRLRNSLQLVTASGVPVMWIYTDWVKSLFILELYANFASFLSFFTCIYVWFVWWWWVWLCMFTRISMSMWKPKVGVRIFLNGSFILLFQASCLKETPSFLRWVEFGSPSCSEYLIWTLTSDPFPFPEWPSFWCSQSPHSTLTSLFL